MIAQSRTIELEIETLGVVIKRSMSELEDSEILLGWEIGLVKE